MKFLGLGRNGKQPPATQDMLFIRGLTEDGVAIMADGTLSRIIEVGPIDMTMKDPGERDRIYAWYTDWIRNLRHPMAIQIVVASTPQDISPWLQRLRQKRDEWKAMAEQARLEGNANREASTLKSISEAGRMAAALARQVAFIEEAHARVRPLVDRYYVTVFYNPFNVRTKRHVLDQETFQKAETELRRRVRLISEGLTRVGLPVTILDAHQMAAVVGDFYHRILSPGGAGESPRVRLTPSLATGWQSETAWTRRDTEEVWT